MRIAKYYSFGFEKRIFTDTQSDEFAPVKNALKDAEIFSWMPPSLLLDVRIVAKIFNFFCLSDGEPYGAT